MKRQAIILILFFLFSGLSNAAVPLEKDYYRIADIKIPNEIELEVGGLAFDDQGRLGVTTRRGELWLITNPESNNPKYTRFAHGLHEPLGLAFKDGSFYCAQRGELTKITDKNGDNKADSYETITRFDLEGNYHEYRYGPVFTPEGDMIVTLNLAWIGHGASLSKWDGWMVKVSPAGEVTPLATGMRSPAGFGYNAAGDMFYTENQGDWVGSGRMTHVEKGDFVGNPEGLKWTGEPNAPLKLKPEDIDETKGWTLYEYAKEVDAVKAPSVWFPHTLMGISTSGLAVIPEGFGPFTGQLLVGDQGHSKIMRVFQEKINGVYQGACFPFVEGFSSGLLRLEWAPDEDALFAGMTSRGWASTGTAPFGLQQLRWTGKTPFEMRKIQVRPNGFQVEFTKAVDPKSLKASIEVNDFTYQYHSTYGSPVTDLQEREIQTITIAEDGRSAMIELDQLRPGYIYEIKINDLKDSAGQAALHKVAYYTLNEIPGGNNQEIAGGAANKNESTEDTVLGKNVNQMPESWEKPDAYLFLGTKPGLKYDKALLEVKAGAKVKFVFENPDDMLHNFVLAKPGTVDKVAVASNELGLKGEAQNYVPEMDEILYHTKILRPNTAETIYFIAPKEPGEYPYVCTFPGHANVMRGILKVK
jgi:uncharacterized cupredoxin-like copper-binding protein